MLLLRDPEIIIFSNQYLREYDEDSSNDSYNGDDKKFHKTSKNIIKNIKSFLKILQKVNFNHEGPKLFVLLILENSFKHIEDWDDR